MPNGSFTIDAIIGYKGGIRHSRVVGIDDALADDAKVQPSDWHADHVDPAVSDYSEANTSFTLAVDGAILSRTIALKAGTYTVHGFVWTTTMGTPGNPGTLQIRKAGSVIASIDMRPTANAKFWIFGVFTHTGGSVTVDLFFDWEAGTTRFGTSGSTEARFGQKMLIERIGD